MSKIIGNTTATPNPRPDWSQTDSTKADFIKNKPVVDQTYSAKSTNAQSGTAVAEGVAEAKLYTDGQISNISDGFSGVILEMYGSDLTEDGAPTIRAIAADEANKAYESSKGYTDQKIPTVNNATLTIQKNGTKVATFTANSSTNATANITVPTGAAADKGVDTSISAASTSTNLPTSKAVAAFVESKGYKTTDNNTTYTFATGDSNGQIKVTPSGGTAQNVSVKGLGTAAYTASTAYATSAQGAKADTAVPNTRTVNGKALSSNITLSASDVGLGNVDNVKQYSVSNPPPYPITKVNNKTGEVTLSASDVGALPSTTKIPTKVSDLTNDKGYITNAPITSVNGKTGIVELNIEDIDNLQKALEERADKSQGIFYIEGDSNSTTDTTNKVATWIGSHDEITEYFSGLTILYKVVTAGSTTTTLNINGLGAVAVVRNATTGISTACPVDGVLLLTYTVDSSGTAYWKTADYDVNTKNTAGTSNKTGTKLFLVGGASQSGSGVTTYTNSNIYVTTGNVLYSAKGFSGQLTGNADTATKATQDASGNVITSTYETKANATEKLNEVNSQISRLSSEIADIKAGGIIIIQDGNSLTFSSGGDK